jgi:hypothetical protein
MNAVHPLSNDSTSIMDGRMLLVADEMARDDRNLRALMILTAALTLGLAVAIAIAVLS